MLVLVINCGSSSLKFQLVNVESEEVLASGICDRIGLEGSVLRYKNNKGTKEERKDPMPD
ncbi:MAG: acetate kinase, partial [Helicobacter sp.]|nr:acetate kinase [Helicobacter sp.]